MEQLIGLGVALVTPFNANNTIDYDALLRLLKHTSTNGADYWVIMGSTGEAITLSNEEQEKILEFVLTNNPHNLPIVFGLGGSNTSALTDRLSTLNLQGVSAILSASPAYNKPTQAGIIAHFTKIADASPVPIILYNVPSRTCSNMEAGTTINLASHPNIMGVKEASGNLKQVEAIITGTPKDFMLTSGDDMLTPAITQLGGKGAISVLANAMPYEFKQLVATALKGEIELSEQWAAKLKEINDLMYVEGNPTGLKEVLNQLNMGTSNVRLPLLPATKPLKDAITVALVSSQAYFSRTKH